MTADDLANKLFSLNPLPLEVLIIAQRSDGRFAAFEPVEVSEERGYAIIVLSPIEMIPDTTNAMPIIDC
jgi:hypothetical protein